MTTISLRISEEINQILDNISKSEDRTKSSLIKIAIRNYLEDLEDYNLAEKRYSEYLNNGKFAYSIEEVKQDLLEDEVNNK